MRPGAKDDRMHGRMNRRTDAVGDDPGSDLMDTGRDPFRNGYHGMNGMPLRRRVSVVTLAVTLVAASLLVTACAGGQEDQSQQLTLDESVVTRGSLESSVEATGTVEPIRSVEVRTQASGEILRMPVDLGDEVESGDALLEIDPRDEVNQLEQARADLERSEAELTVARSRLDRMQALRDSGVVTTEEYESALVSHANARSAFVLAETQLELAQEQRADATVTAPISGIVIQKNVEEGQVVTGTRDLTGGTVLLVLADLANVQVRTLVDESEIGGVQPGLPASITVEAYPDRTFQGEVLQVEPQATVEQNVTMFAVLSRIPNDERLLKPGMNANVEIVMGERTDVLKLANGGVKMPSEARELVSAIGMDPALLEQRVAVAGEFEGDVGARGNASTAGEGEGGAAEADVPSLDELASMSQSERRELIQSLDPPERRELMTRMRESGNFSGSAAGPPPGAARGSGSGGSSPGGFRSGGISGGFGAVGSSRSVDRSSPRDAFAFVRTPNGGLTLRPIRVGLSSWEETEILAGLEEGDTVVNVPLALVQQTEMLNRFRDRMPGLGGF